MAKTKRPRRKRGGKNEKGHRMSWRNKGLDLKDFGMEGRWKEECKRECFRMNWLEAVGRNRICYRSNSVEEDMRLIRAFERNRIEGNIEAEAGGAEIKLPP
jgi:hypothetical protein